MLTEIPHLRKATERHKLMCGCETCLTVMYAQQALNDYRNRKLVSLKNSIHQMKTKITTQKNQQRGHEVEKRLLTACKQLLTTWRYNTIHIMITVILMMMTHIDILKRQMQ